MLGLDAHPNRRTLRQAGMDLPGVLVCDVAPGLDVLSPYEAGPCSDANLEDLFRLMDAPQFGASYGCVVIDSPPFLGANPGQLVGAADGFIVVSRAEPLAHRTLPAFLELVQRSQGDRSVKMHGILLTLPDGEGPGGRWERELRGRLGGRALAQVIPFDEEVSLAFEAHRVAAEKCPDSPAAVQYRRLADFLELASDPAPLKKSPGAAPLLAASAALLEPVGAAARHGEHRPPARRAKPARRVVELIPHDDPPADLDLPLEPDLPSFAGLASVPAPSLTLPAFRPPPSTTRAKLTPAPTGPEEAPAAPAAARPQYTGIRSLLLGVGLAIAIGVGLRFIALPDFMLPIAVGLAVTAAVVLAMRMILTAPEAAKKQDLNVSAALPANPRKQDSADGRKDMAGRLAVPKRPSPSGLQRRLRKQ
jgi:cellulose biosynthesis protein BcsQ